MAKRRRKRSYREACARDLSNGNHSSFSKGCARRFPELAGAKGEHPRKKAASAEVPAECNQVLSEEMRKGNRKGAMKKYWACRRAREAGSRDSDD